MDDSAIVLDMIKSTGRLFFGMKPGNNSMRSMIHGEMFILDYLDRKCHTAMPGEISSMTGRSTARTAIALRNLEEKGLIVRDIDKADRRKIIVSITEEGRKLTREEREAMQSRMSAVIEVLGEDDAREYIRITKRIVEISEQQSKLPIEEGDSN